MGQASASNSAIANRDNTSEAKGTEVVAAPASAEAGSNAALTQVSPAVDAPAGDGKPTDKRKKAKATALILLLTLVACFAWYPLSDHYAPSVSGASVTAEVTQIAARVSGPVHEVAVGDNAEVTAGQTLFTIDDTTYQLDVDLARAQLDQVLNSFNSSLASIPAAEAKLEQSRLALATANDDLERTRQLFEKGLVPQTRLASVEAAQSSAVLNVDAAEAELHRLTTSIGAVDENNPSVRTARANLEKAEFALANTRVTAPADGYVTNLSLTAGQFVGAGTPALTFIKSATQMVIADFRENQLINVEPGDAAIVTFEAAPGQQFAASVESVAWGINSGRTSVNGLSQSSNDARWFPPARKIPVRIKIEDIDALPSNVRLGSEAHVLVIPEQGPVPAIAQWLLGISGFVAGFN